MSTFNIKFIQQSFSFVFIFIIPLFLPTSGLLPVFSQETSILSQEIFLESNQLLPDFTDTYGVIFNDLNSDSWPDIYVVRFRNLNRLFLHSSDDLAYWDFTIQAGLGGNLMPRGLKNLELGASSADINNDGMRDIIIAGWGESTRIYLQQKDGYFDDITQTSGLQLPIDGNGAFWADVNLDGYLDIFITDEHHANHLYLGDGRGNFQNVSENWGITGQETSQGATFSDIDLDGYPDLYVCNWFAPDILYRNINGDRFEAAQLEIPHLQRPLNSNGVVFSDIDNDGDPDLLVTDRDGQSSLYQNNMETVTTRMKFEDMSEKVGLRLPGETYGSIITDFNNDGKKDIWISTIGPNYLFLQKESLNFKIAFENKPPAGSGIQYYSTGAACADLDRDGDLDLFVSNKDTNSLIYLNQTNNSDYIQFRLIGVRSNRDAIGAKLWLYSHKNVKGTSQLIAYQEISGGSGYLSQNSSVIHLGLPSRGFYHAIIQFPGGAEKILENLQSGRHYTVEEMGGLGKLFYRGRANIYRIIGQSDFTLVLLLYVLLIGTVISYIFFSTYRYRWAIRHIVIFFGFTILLLYGIFIALQEMSIQNRLVYQISSLLILISALTFFMEKIRRMELNRIHYRQLLRDFTRQLILIKNTDELFKLLFEMIQSSVKPEFCLVFKVENSTLINIHSSGEVQAPGIINLTQEENDQLTSKGFLKSLQERFPTAYQWGISREQLLYGLLVIKPSKFNKKFSQEDFSVFENLTIQLAIAIQNNEYIEDTKQLIRRITAAETREKYLKELEETNQKLKKNNKELKKLYQDLKDTQAQLVQSEKMASLGQLVAGVAHELNNPISYIYANMKELENYIDALSELIAISSSNSDSREQLNSALQQLREKYDLNYIREDIHSIIAENIEGSQRVKQVVQNLRDFSRLDESDIKLVDLHEGLDSTLLLLNNEVKNRITIHKDYGDLPKVSCRPVNINQVFMNILLNAIQVTGDKGNIWIKTEPHIETVEISIRDDGRGIPAAIKNKIFDPFFTTKTIGQGTGLGLSISYNIIKEHQGKLTFTSEEGRGTIFKIVLPVKPKPPKTKKN
jgi:signal transduction histidine kinase